MQSSVSEYNHKEPVAQVCVCVCACDCVCDCTWNHVTVRVRVRKISCNYETDPSLYVGRVGQVPFW